MVRRQVLACMLVAALVSPVPAYSSGSPAVLGIATSSHAARIGQNALHPGATIFSGDTLLVGPEGSAVISVSSDSLARFAAETSAHLLKPANAGGVVIELRSGQMVFRTNGAGALEVRLGDAVIRGAGNGPVLAAIAYLSPEKVVIGAERGSVTVSTARNRRSVTVGKGEQVEVMLADPPRPQATAPAGASLSAGKVAIIGVIMAVGITVIAFSIRNQGLTRAERDRLLFVSPSVP